MTRLHDSQSGEIRLDSGGADTSIWPGVGRLDDLLEAVLAAPH